MRGLLNNEKVLIVFFILNYLSCEMNSVILTSSTFFLTKIARKKGIPLQIK